MKTGYKTKFKWVHPPYYPAFELTSAYDSGILIAETIEKWISGGMGCEKEDAALLAEVIFRAGHSDHLELGTLFGGTAILVAMAKRQFGFEGDVHCVDNFSYLSEDYPVGKELVLENAAAFDVADRIKVFEGDTYPLPPDITEHHYGSAYIDAAHDFPHCQRDWLSVKDISDLVVFHDYDFEHMGVVSAVRNAMQEPGWWLVHLSHHTAIFERLDWSVR